MVADTVAETARFSFCIPTYNTGKYIGAALDSIAAQPSSLHGDIEIVIADGASSDDTPTVVEAWRARKPSHVRVVYLRGEENLGVDRDLARAVDAATGTHCWLMSADDALAPGALATMRNALAQADVALCDRTLCDLELSPIGVQHWLDIDTRTFDVARRDELLAYLRASRSIGALFSFCSSIAFSKAAWNNGAVDDGVLGSNFAHVHRLWSALLSRPTTTTTTTTTTTSRLRSLREPLVLCRGDNDSFARKGKLRRFLIDIDGYLLIARKLFPSALDDEVRDAFLAVMQHEHPWWRLAGPRGDAGDAWPPLRDKLVAFGYPAPLLAAAGALGARPTLLATARRLRRAAKRVRGASRRS
jgi:abequosyltransferase